MTLTEMKQAVEKLQAEIEAYEKRPTKASSKRLRMLAMDIKKGTTAFKQFMLEEDKK